MGFSVMLCVDEPWTVEVNGCHSMLKLLPIADFALWVVHSMDNASPIGKMCVL